MPAASVFAKIIRGELPAHAAARPSSLIGLGHSNTVPTSEDPAP